jgi:NAD(P)-dependent dehydrogenase (short-subunit alcohol dehydrogenase family)
MSASTAAGATSLVRRQSRSGVAMVVGGTSGIGQGIAEALARRNYQVILCGRSQERGDAIVESLKNLSPPSSTTEGDQKESPLHQFLPIDAFDLKSVKSVAQQAVSGGSTKLDVLVMTQSMASVQGYTPTKDGLDQKLQLHYFSRVYLAMLLAPHMNVAPSTSASCPRILSVLSAGVHAKYKNALDDFELKDHYSTKNAADAAGFYNDAALEHLAKDHRSIAFCHAAPGFVNTNWGTELPWAAKLLLRPIQAAFGRSLHDSGEYLTSGLLDNIKGPGLYLMGEKGQILDNDKNVKHTPDERDAIWENTLRLLPDLN